ncbi:hypothetical protein [Rubritalea marina]|uniref:hypothetical protein n=1 Tax=Rubritalea marina TaxID=361055 RepID=UPI000363E7AC|nr:hypothetical protein [Rubritalea marina]
MKLLFLIFALIPSLAAASPHAEQWLKISILCQNAGHAIHAMGIDSGDDTSHIEQFAHDIGKELDQLVAAGILEKATFTIKPALDIEESVAIAVTSLVRKHAAEYGIFSLREMMDLGARQQLTVFDDKTPITLNVRLPKDILVEFRGILKDQQLEQ